MLYRKKLPRKFPPCTREDWGLTGICGSEDAIVKVFAQPRFISIYCGNDHQRSTQWIAHHKFLPGGEYEDAEVPLHLLSASVTKKRYSDYRPSDTAKVRALRYGRCCVCAAPALKRFGPRSIAKWLSQHDLPLYRRLCDAAGRMITDDDIADRWQDDVPESLWTEALNRARDSALEADHLYPVDLLEGVRARVPARVFQDGAKNLIVPTCSACNRGRKAIILEDARTLEARLIEVLFEGKPGLAQGERLYDSFVQLLGPCLELADRKRRARRSSA